MANYNTPTISIPPELPDILKQFTKAAIKAQPKDVLAWSTAHFSNRLSGQAPKGTETGISSGSLRVLHRQLSHHKTVAVDKIREKWQDLCMSLDSLEQLLLNGRLGKHVGKTDEVKWREFLAVACLECTNSISEALELACEITTSDRPVASTRCDGAYGVSFSEFKQLYSFMALQQKNVPYNTYHEAILYIEKCSEQDNCVLPKHFTSANCPVLA